MSIERKFQLLPKLSSHNRTPNISQTTHKKRIVKYVFRNNSVNIDARNAILLPLDSSHRGESNEPKFVKIRSLDGLKTGVCTIRNFENTLKYAILAGIYI